MHEKVLSRGPAGPRMMRPRQVLRRGMTLLPRRLFLVNGSRGCRSVCLTFDDGPHPEHTPRLLDVLAERGVRATFFVVGREVERCPDVVRRIAAEGHELGHHSFTHSEPRQTSAGTLVAEVERTRRLLAEVVGGEYNLFRPPKGELTAGKLWALWRAKQTVVLWNRDPCDFAGPTTEAVRQRAVAMPLSSGDVVLLHDNVPHAAWVVRDLVDRAAGRGLGFATVGRWIVE